MTRIKLSEGTLFILPVGTNYCIGLITRINKKQIPLGYFFKPLLSSIPNMVDDLNFSNENIVLISEFGNQGFKNNSWKLLGTLKNFNRIDWPVPIFYHHTAPFKPVLVHFDDNMNEILRESIQDESYKYESLPKTGLGGAGFIEKSILKMLKQSCI